MKLHKQFIGIIKTSRLYKNYSKRKMLKSYISHEKQEMLREAEEKFKSSGRQLHGDLEDYKKSLDKQLISFNEYEYQYEFWNKTEVQKEEFVSRIGMRVLYRMHRPQEIYALCRNKVSFLRRYRDFIHRDFIVAQEVELEQFADFVSNKDCIAKPIDEVMGRGVFKIVHGEIKDVTALYHICKESNCLIEDCISGCDEIQEFHPQSLNSIRVVTIASDKKSKVFGAFLRIGRGESVVDNAHAGGVFAQINVDTGIIESEGISTDGERFELHPDTNKKIKGYRIPRWEEIKRFCIEASLFVPNTFIVGWDVVINKKGDLELLEGNGGPDFDVMQSPLKVGVKGKLQHDLVDIFGSAVRCPF